MSYTIRARRRWASGLKLTFLLQKSHCVDLLKCVRMKSCVARVGFGGRGGASFGFGIVRVPPIPSHSHQTSASPKHRQGSKPVWDDSLWLLLRKMFENIGWVGGHSLGFYPGIIHVQSSLFYTDGSTSYIPIHDHHLTFHKRHLAKFSSYSCATLL